MSFIPSLGKREFNITLSIKLYQGCPAFGHPWTILEEEALFWTTQHIHRH